MAGSAAFDGTSISFNFSRNAHSNPIAAPQSIQRWRRIADPEEQLAVSDREVRIRDRKS